MWYICVLIAFAYLFNLKDWDFVHYHTELVPMLMLLLSIYFYTKYLLNFNKTFLFFVGIFLAFAFLGKLQTIPFIAFLGLFFLFFERNTSLLNKFIFISGGAFSIFLFVVAICYAGGYLDKAYFYYIERNLNYSSNNVLKNILNYIKSSPLNLQRGYVISNYIIVFLPVFSLLPIIKHTKVSLWQIFCLFSLWIISFYTVFKTGRQYEHYFYFLLLPFFVQLSWIVNITSKVNLKLLKPIYFSIVTIILLTSMAYSFQAMQDKKNVFNNFVMELENKNVYSLTNKLKKMAQQPQFTDAKMLVWGWGGAIHILSEIPQATPDNHLDYLESSSPQSFHKTLSYFLADLYKNKPKIVIIQNHEFKINEVEQYIHKQYQYLFSENFCDVYIRKNI